MPYKIQSEGNKFCVVKETDGKVMGCHPTKAEAQAQLRALYANSGGEKLETIQLAAAGLPAKVDSCISKVMADWKKDPKSMPAGMSMMTPEEIKSHAVAICRSSLKMEELVAEQDRVLLEKKGPALLAVAVTSKPHIDQRSAEEKSKRIELVEINGEKFVKVPLFKRGIYRHPDGTLVFNDAFINRLKENYDKKIVGRPVYLDFRHGDQYGALAYLDPEDGGKIEMGADNWLYAYGRPTVENIGQIIKQWPHASAEFHPNYEENLLKKLSMDDMAEIEQIELAEDIPSHKQVVKTISLQNISKTQTEVKMNILEDGSATLTAEEVVQIQGLQEKVTKLEAEVTRLTPKTEPELPEAYRVRLETLEAENRAVKEQQLREKVAFSLEKAKAYRDENGRGHSTIFLDMVRAGLLLEEAKVGETVIKLEADNEEGKVRFYKNLLSKMLEVIPGQVPMNGKTVGEDTPLEAGYGHYTEDELKLEIEAFSKY